jgi:hypothetical protein
MLFRGSDLLKHKKKFNCTQHIIYSHGGYEKKALILYAVILIFGLFILTHHLHAQSTWYVDDDAPGDPAPGDSTFSDPAEDGSIGHPFDAIQEGIDAAGSGDTVLVLDGTYTGSGNKDLDFNGKAITVQSENGPENCIIHASFQAEKD